MLKQKKNPCRSGGMCRICRSKPRFRKVFGVTECPKGYEFDIDDTAQKLPTQAMPVNAVCTNRGERTGSCSCGAIKYKCNLLGITVRTSARPNHPNDIVCNTDCPKYETGEA